MKKCYCDICSTEIKGENTTLLLPVYKPNYAKDTRGSILKQFGENLVLENKDVCSECQNKLAAIINIIPNIVVNRNYLSGFDITLKNE